MSVCMQGKKDDSREEVCAWTDPVIIRQGEEQKKMALDLSPPPQGKQGKELWH